MDTADADLGSVNPIYVELPGATPSKMILQVSKDGHLYILDAAALGRLERRPRSTSWSRPSGMSIHGTPAAYQTAHGPTSSSTPTNGANMCPGGVTRPRDRGGAHLAPAQPAGRRRSPGARRSPAARRPRRSRRPPTAPQRDRLVHQQREHAQGASTATPARRSINGTGSTCRACSAGPRRSRSTTRSSSAATATSAPGHYRKKGGSYDPSLSRWSIGDLRRLRRYRNWRHPRYSGHERKRGQRGSSSAGTSGGGTSGTAGTTGTAGTGTAAPRAARVTRVAAAAVAQPARAAAPLAKRSAGGRGGGTAGSTAGAGGRGGTGGSAGSAVK